MRNVITKTVFFASIFLLFFFGTSSAQINICDYNGNNQLTGQVCVRTIITSVPYLRAITDARSGGMGNNRLTTTPDANAIFYNSSKLAFVDRKVGFSSGFTSWLPQLDLENTWLGTFSGYIAIDQLQTIGFSLRRFSPGTIAFTDENGQPLVSNKPFETDFGLSYNRQFGERFAVGFTLKYIYSKLAEGQTTLDETIIPASALAGDISFTYKAPLNDFTELTLGSAITNLGPKISYAEGYVGNYMPTNLGIGTGIQFIFKDNFWMHTALDVNRLLVLSPPYINNYIDGYIPIPEYREASAISGIFRSFSDASGGFKEEMQENTYSLGMEIYYDSMLFRVGHFNEHKRKGNRKYMTFGIGVNYNKKFSFDFSFLKTVGKNKNLDETFYISLLVNLMEIE